MLTNEEKKKIEELTKSEYFDYLTEKKLNTKISEKLKYAKWIISSVLSIIVTIGVITGIKFKAKLTTTKKSLDTLQVQVDKEMVRFQAKGDSIIQEMNQKMDDFNKKIAGEEDDIETRQEIFNTHSQLLHDSSKYLKENTIDFFKKYGDLKETLDKFEKQKVTLDSLKKELKEKIANSEKLKKQVQSAILTKYMCVERGSIESYKKDHKKVTMNLPDSDSTITVIFYDAKFHKEIVEYNTKLKKSNKRRYKEASIHIIIKDSDGTQIMEQSSLLREQNEEKIEGTRFYIEPLIIYFPPNTVGLHISGFPLKNPPKTRIWQGKYVM